MKKNFLFLSVFLFTLLLSLTAFAGTWKQDTKGWWWDNGDGTYPKSTWQWCDGNNDGLAECYYFDENGYCLQNTTTPDGCLVDANGAWIVNGVIQTKAVSITQQTTAAASTAAASTAAASTAAASTAAAASAASTAKSSNWDTHTGNVTFTGHYYATPSGKCYHYSIECGGKNSREISAEAAKKLKPCGTCVLK